MLGLPADLLDVLDVSGLVVVLDDLGGGAAPPKERKRREMPKRFSSRMRGEKKGGMREKLTRPIELPVRETFRRTRSHTRYSCPSTRGRSLAIAIKFVK